MSGKELSNDEKPMQLLRPESDYLLEILVSMANSVGVSVGVTILTHGFLISGMLVGGAEYFEALGRGFGSAKGTTPEMANALQKAFSSGAEPYRLAKMGEDVSMTPTAYIHLKDARFFSGQGAPIQGAKGTEGMLWRGRLSEVSGFTVGNLS